MLIEGSGVMFSSKELNYMVLLSGPQQGVFEHMCF